MKELGLVVLLGLAAPSWALSPDAREFMEITKALQPLQCERRQLRRAIALAEAEQRGDDARALRKKFAALDKDPKTARLERRLARLEPRLEKSSDPEDLAAISRQQREAFYRCE